MYKLLLATLLVILSPAIADAQDRYSLCMEEADLMIRRCMRRAQDDFDARRCRDNRDEKVEECQERRLLDRLPPAERRRREELDRLLR